MAPKDTSRQSAVARLIQIVGAEHVLTEESDRAFFAHDVYRMKATPLAVVRTGSVDELCRAVTAATSEGIAIVPRGGGASCGDGMGNGSEDAG